MTKVSSSPLKHKYGDIIAHRGSDGVFYSDQVYHQKSNSEVNEGKIAAVKEVFDKGGLDPIQAQLQPFIDSEKYSVEELEKIEKRLINQQGGQMEVNFARDSKGAIVTAEEKIREDKQISLSSTWSDTKRMLNEEFGEDNVTGISNTLGVDVASGNTKITKGQSDQYTNTGNIYMVQHDDLSIPKIIELQDDSSFTLVTENDLRDRDPNFFNRYNKIAKEDYYKELGQATGYFSDFDGDGMGSYTYDEFDEDTVVEALTPLLKKYGIKVKEAVNPFGDYVTIYDDNGNEETINLTLFKTGGTPIRVGTQTFSTPKKNKAQYIQNDISQFVKQYGTQFEDTELELDFSDTKLQEAKNKAKHLKIESSDELNKYNLYNQVNQDVEGKTKLLNQYNDLESEEEKEAFLLDNGYAIEKIKIGEYEISQLELETNPGLIYGLSAEDRNTYSSVTYEDRHLYEKVDKAMEQMLVGTDKMRDYFGAIVYDVEETIDIKNENVRSYLVEFFLNPNNKEILNKISAGGGFKENIELKEQLLQSAENIVLKSQLAELDVEKREFNIVRGNFESRTINFQKNVDGYLEEQNIMLEKINPLSNNLDLIETQAKKVNDKISGIIDDINSFDVDNMSASDYEVYNSLIRQYDSQVTLLTQLDVDHNIAREKYNTVVTSDEMRSLLEIQPSLQEEQDRLIAEQGSFDTNAEVLSNKYNTLLTGLGYNASTRVFDPNYKVTKELEEYQGVFQNRPVMQAINSFNEEYIDTALKMGGWIVDFGTDVYADFGGDIAKANYIDDYVRDFIAADLSPGGGVAPRTEGIAEAGLTVENTLRTTAEMLPFTINLILAARSGNVKYMSNATKVFNPKAITSEGLRKLHRQKNMIKVTTAMTMYDNAQFGEAQGLTGLNKWQFASAMSLSEGVAQLVMPDQNFLAGTAGKTWRDNLVGGLRSAITIAAGKQIVKNQFKNLAKELGEEELTLVMQDVAKLSHGLGNTVVFDDIEAHADLFMGCLFLTSTIGISGNVKTYNAIKAKVQNEMLIRGDQNLENIRTQLSVINSEISKFKKFKNPPLDKLAHLEKTKEQLEDGEIQAEAMLHAANTAPANASFNHQDLLAERFKLIKSKDKTTDKGELQSINKKITELDKQVESVAAHDQYLADQKKDVEDTKKKVKVKYEESQEEISEIDKEIAALEARSENIVTGKDVPDGLDLVETLDRIEALKEKKKGLKGTIEVVETNTAEEASEILEIDLNERIIRIDEQIAEASKPGNRDVEGGEVELIDLKQQRAYLSAALQGVGDINQEQLNDAEINAIDRQIANLNPNGSDAVQQRIKELTDQRNKLEQQLNQSLGFEGFTSNGFIVTDVNGNRKIIINKRQALRKGYVTTGQHEFLHIVLNDAVGKVNQPGLADAMFTFINENQNIKFKGNLNNRLAAYKPDDQYFEAMPLLSEALSSKDVVANEGFLGKMKDIFRQTLQKYGAKDVSFNTGEDVFNFIKDYNKTIKSGKKNKAFAKITKEGISGDLVNRAINRTEGVQFSKTVQDTFKKYPDMKKDFDELTQNPDGTKRWDSKQEFRNSPEFWDGYLQIETSKGLEALIKFGVSSATGISTKEEMDQFVEDAKKNLLKRYETNFNASMVNGSLFGWLTGGSGEYTNSTLYRAKGDVMVKYGKQVPTIGIPVDERLDLVGEEDAGMKAFEKQDVTQDKPIISKKDRIRKLRSLNTVYKAVTPIDLNNKIQTLIAKNPKNLEEQLTKLIEEEVTKAVQEQMGTISFKDGKVVVSEEYKEYFAVNYENIVQSLDVATIKNNYNQLFDLEVISKEDRTTRKKDKPTLKKDSNYRKGIYQITTNKARFTKFFIDTSSLGRDGKPLAPQSHYNKIRDRQKKLAILIAGSVMENVVNNEIIENSTNMNAIVEAKIREYANSLNKQKKEVQGNYNDIIQFSKEGERDSRKLKALAREHGFDNVFNDDGTLRSKWKKELKLPNNTSASDFIYSLGKQAILDDLTNLEFLPKLYHKMYKAGKRGTAFENSIIDTIISLEKEFGKDTVYAALRKPSEADSLPDVVLRLQNKLFNIEAKMAKAQYSSVTFSVDKNTGKFSIKKDYSFNERLLKELGESAQDGIQLAKDRLALEIDPTTGKSFKWTNLSLLPTNLYHILTSEKIDFRGKEQSYLSAMNPTIDFDLDGVSEIYNNKKHPVNYIHLMGRGLFYMGGYNAETNILGTPEFKGMGEIKLRVVSNSQTRTVNKVKEKTGNTILNWRAIPSIPNETLSELIPHEKSLDDAQGIRNIINSTEGQLLIQMSKSADVKAVSNAVQFSRTVNPSKGITVLDFDDTLATTKSLVKFTKPDGTTGTLNAEQYANTYEDLLDKGYVFDFSDFNKVVEGKLAPLFNKAIKLQGKFGPENMFVLTARPPQAAKAIFDFLKANGLNIPMKNITGLANSTAEAKALWMAEKVANGYNDFYFADDALQNVQAVKNMLNQFDVKSKVQQAKIQFSKSVNKEFNDIIENVTGIESGKRFSAIKARKRGANKGKFRFFIPPSHEDFVGLLYNFIGKGREGDAHRDFFENALIKPLNRAYIELNTAKQSIANDYKSLNKKFKDVKKKLNKKTPDGDFTYQDAIRIYLWNKHGHKVFGLSPTDQAKLTALVMADPNLQAYAETLNIISKQDAYVKPSEGWNAGDIRADLDDATGRVGRADFFTEFNENSEIIFSQENLNKIEAAYGADVVSAIKDILYRTKTGRNRPNGQNELTNRFMNYLNGSVAATMFFNIRSSVLQQMSMVNFINFGDNNILAAAKAFANQPQYYADWATIFNSDFMKQRRGGIKTDINGAELAASLRGAKNTPRALLAKLLELGFLPTQIGDNIAIATGGSTFYRNRINTYLKQGMTQKEAESKAWIDFQALAEATQQSARPDMVSQQQASPLGKIILAFQNVTSQFNRLGKKAFLDIKNRRITPGNATQLQSDMSNASRIAYYFAIQNVIFYSLQTALFSALFDDDEEDERMLAKKERVINGTIDSVLRGSGVWGAVISTIKNMAIKYHEQRGKDWNGNESSVLVEMLNVSPPLGIKARKIVNAERTLNYNKSVIEEMETFDIDNPHWSAYTSYTEAITNIPLNRLYNKTQNVRQSLDNQHTAYQRALMFSGWSQWNLGIGDSEKIEEVKETIKKKKKIITKKKQKIKKEEKKKQVEEENKTVIKDNKKKSKKDGICSAISKSGKRCKTKVVKGKLFCTIHEKVEQNETGKQSQCKGTRTNKKRCGMMTSNKSGYCYYHD